MNPAQRAGDAADGDGVAATGDEIHAAPGDGAEAEASGEPSKPVAEVPFGAWPSPITAAQVAGGRTRVAYPTVIGETTWWQEDKPDEGGRTTIARSGRDGAVTALLPAPWTARTRVHEYGGRSYLPVPSPVATATLAAAARAATRPRSPVVFANLDDQRLYLAGAERRRRQGQAGSADPGAEKGGERVPARGRRRARQESDRLGDAA